MQLKFYNSLTRRVEPFEPIESGKAGLYTCGPTVYNFAHIGNFRAYAFEDILHRTLEYAGLKLVHVMNLTDVDDKTIRDSRACGAELRQYTQRFKDAFFEDLATLSIKPATVYPAATDHIPEMIALIERLFAAGVAYKAPDGCVYFSVSKFPEYGKLAHLDRSGMRSGVRISNDEYAKDDVGDFALWKAWDENDGAVKWDSPWGPGRPGWHIECSAMSMKYLGESFDLHTGGIDNLFPHHENEIAQAEAATGKRFVSTWMHCAHLRVNGEKMSKSLGNFYTLRDLTAMGWSGREIRYVLIAAHYRQPLNFAFDALSAARTALSRIDEFTARMKEIGGGFAAPECAPDWVKRHVDAFDAALCDDLNTPLALAAVFSLVNDGNRLAEGGEMAASGAAAALAAISRMDAVLGVLEKPAAAIPPEVLALLDERTKARAAKDWAASDRLRDEIAALGWVVKDTRDGPRLTAR
ncbi:MAG: cysteine--tRNA ligase [Kiritimatiellae bacterium]|nr:cysteine--tRNA ligase [Kiritimatiellia bacterium]